MRRALIIGSQGQDGSYLFELLNRQGYFVTGLDRRGGRVSDGSLTSPFDVTDTDSVKGMMANLPADEIYYLAAYHHSSEEKIFDDNMLLQRSWAVHVQGLSSLLEAARRMDSPAKIFYAASSHVFGSADTSPQDETTAIKPNCIYGITKAAAISLCQYYREHHGLFVSVGILYNHESPRRKETFVTQKIIRAARAIAREEPARLVLGDLQARVDWGWAPDYVEAMGRILKLSYADDFIIATGETHSVEEFVTLAFSFLGLDWRKWVLEDKSLIKKTGKNFLCGSAAKLKAATGWEPTVSFKYLVQRMMMAHEIPK